MASGLKATKQLIFPRYCWKTSYIKIPFRYLAPWYRFCMLIQLNNCCLNQNLRYNLSGNPHQDRAIKYRPSSIARTQNNSRKVKKQVRQ